MKRYPLYRCRRPEKRHLHCLPPVCAEEQMYHVVLLLALPTQVAIDHLSNRRRPIYTSCISKPTSVSIRNSSLHTWEAHKHHLMPVLLQRFDKHLTLRCLASSIEALKHNKLSSRHYLRTARLCCLMVERRSEDAVRA